MNQVHDSLSVRHWDVIANVLAMEKPIVTLICVNNGDECATYKYGNEIAN